MENRYAQLIWTAKTGRGMHGTRHRVEACQETLRRPAAVWSLDEKFREDRNCAWL